MPYTVSDFSSPLFDDAKKWLNKNHDKHNTWDGAEQAYKNNDDQLKSFLENQYDNNDWPLMMVDEWKQLVALVKFVALKDEHLRQSQGEAEISTVEKTEKHVPDEEHSSWQMYKKSLENAGFHKNAIENIERSSLAILKNLQDQTEKAEPIKGLVVGNVQSGKTANMAGLMAMAADWGWNMFIVLSGTIENLRVQTAERLVHDLNQENCNITWSSLSHPNGRSPVGERLSDLSIGKEEYSRNKYLTVCLKVKSRLEGLLDWLQKDKNKCSNLKILLIDDEADQASINTGKIAKNEMKTINRLICNLVYCRSKDARDSKTDVFKGSYKTMSYVCYTATPYANCLNEKGPGTLYPSSFIYSLPIHPEYFGPIQFFGANDCAKEHLDIVREVPTDDVTKVVNLHDGKTNQLCQSMKDSVLWFFNAVAALRHLGYMKPVSMLIHTSQKQGLHTRVFDALLKWISDNRSNIPKMCKTVYERECVSFTKKQLRERYSEYAVPDDKIWDYPSFDEISSEIATLVEEVSQIRISDENATPVYTRHVHVCIDNSQNNGVTDDGVHARLLYPDDRQIKEMGYAPAFIVIGGNTLSRGLTIKGLVSTFFMRSVGNADTLMQMGRWFGYRRHYELFPRVWMEEKTRFNFEYMTEMDMNLRAQIQLFQLSSASPSDFYPAFLASPIKDFELVSRMKSQSAQFVHEDYSGRDSQLTVYPKDVKKLLNNKKATEAFVSSLAFAKSDVRPCNLFAKNVAYENVFDYLRSLAISESSSCFSNLDDLEKWVHKKTDDGQLGKWSVVLAGIANGNQKWGIRTSFPIFKIHRSSISSNSNTFNIGVLSDKRDYLSDIAKTDIDDDGLFEEMQKSESVSTNYQVWRAKANKNNIPMLIIYCIDGHSPASSKNRQPLSLDEDVFAFSMVLPGNRPAKAQHYVQMRH